MKAVLQRAAQAQVDIIEKDGNISHSIEQGLVVLAGIMQGDTPAHIRLMAKKTCEMRIFEDDQGKMNRSLLDIDGEMLIVSNFTLGADCKKGTRPSFSNAAPPAEAVPLYELFISECRRLGVRKVETGEFGADMRVSLVNDGPVTIILDSDKLTQPKGNE